jgi:rubredoxin
VNRVYDVSHKTEGVYYAVGGENRSKAILSYIYETNGDTWDFINYRARLARNHDGKPIETDNSGILSMRELMPKGYNIWWECPECSSEGKFEYVEIDKYKCKNCGYVGNIPFAD